MIGNSGTLPKPAELLRVIAWAAILSPLAILAHELGHFVVGHALGYSVRMGVASVSGGAVLGLSPDLHVVLQASAGPFVTIGLLVVAAVALRREIAPAWAVALAICAPLRFLVGGSFLLFAAKASWDGTTFQGKPNFDEYNAAMALGVSPVALVALEIVALTTFWIWSVLQVRKGSRLLSVGSALLGVSVGVSLWMAMIGPRLVNLIK